MALGIARSSFPIILFRRSTSLRRIATSPITARLERFRPMEIVHGSSPWRPDRRAQWMGEQRSRHGLQWVGQPKHPPAAPYPARRRRPGRITCGWSRPPKWPTSKTASTLTTRTSRRVMRRTDMAPPCRKRSKPMQVVTSGRTYGALSLRSGNEKAKAKPTHLSFILPSARIPRFSHGLFVSDHKRPPHIDRRMTGPHHKKKPARPQPSGSNVERDLRRRGLGSPSVGHPAPSPSGVDSLQGQMVGCPRPEPG